MESSEILFLGVSNGRTEGWSDACFEIATRLRMRAKDPTPLDTQELLAIAADLTLLPSSRVSARRR